MNDNSLRYLSIEETVATTAGMLFQKTLLTFELRRPQ